LTLILNGTDNSATTPAVTGTDTDTGVYYPASNQVALATNGTLALLVNSAQDVGIGTTTPDIFANSFARNLGVFISGVGTTSSINVSGGAASRIQFGVGTTRYGLIYQDDTNFMQIATTTALPISFLTNNVERIRIPSNASGITFPATQVASADANTLDDYEEGTWTPVFLAGGITGTSITYSGTYTKIGRVVSVSFRAQSASNNINVSSYVVFSGLPFTVGVKGCGSATTEDIDVFASLGFAEASGTSLGLSKCGNGTTSDLNAMVTFFV